MLKIIGIIVIIYSVYKFCNALETIAKDYEEKKNDGWIDYKSNEGFRA